MRASISGTDPMPSQEEYASNWLDGVNIRFKHYMVIL